MGSFYFATNVLYKTIKYGCSKGVQALISRGFSLILLHADSR